MVGGRYEVDQTRPSIARIYDYLLGGKDNYAVDREIGDRFIHGMPGSVAIAFANRQALVRGVRDIALQTGVRQFIDMGSGLPTADNVRQVAQRHAPDARVVYVDNDPVVPAHGRALLEENDRTTVITADVREPQVIRHHPGTTELMLLQVPDGPVRRSNASARATCKGRSTGITAKSKSLLTRPSSLKTRTMQRPSSSSTRAGAW